MSVKSRQPKLAPSHRDSSPEEGSAIEMTQQLTHQTDSLLFPCPEEGCTKSYMTHGRLEQQLIYGKHDFHRAESISLLDRAKVSYAERLEAGGSHSEATVTGTKIHCGYPCLPEGWAGRESAKPRHRFNSKQKRYLEGKFQHGETTRVKASPDDLSKEMRCLRDENGKRIFTVEEFLRPQQISSFFSEWHVREEMPPTPMTRLKNLRGSRRQFTRMWSKRYSRKSLIPCCSLIRTCA